MEQVFDGVRLGELRSILKMMGLVDEYPKEHSRTKPSSTYRSCRMLNFVRALSRQALKAEILYLGKNPIWVWD
jgi:hypothetical protein